MERHGGEARINLKKLRMRYGWYQWEAAERLGCTRAYVSAIERGSRKITLSVMEAIIRVFGVEYEDFYRKETYPHEESYRKGVYHYESK